VFVFFPAPVIAAILVVCILFLASVTILIIVVLLFFIKGLFIYSNHSYDRFVAIIIILNITVAGSRRKEYQKMEEREEDIKQVF
jgi:uncharacterized protein YxeA